MAKTPKGPKQPKKPIALSKIFEDARKSMNLVKETNENNNNSDTALPIMENAQLTTLEKADPAIQDEAKEVLKKISEISGKILEINKSIQDRSDDLTRKEKALIKSNEEKNKRSEELNKKKAELDQRQVDLGKKELYLADKKHELELRELDELSGFANQKIEYLGKLKEEIRELELKKNEIRCDIHQAEQQARDDETERLNKLMEREKEIAIKERCLNIESKELEREKTAIREEAFHEAELEIKRHDQALQRTEANLEKVHQDLMDAEEQLEQYRELSEALAVAKQKPQELLQELTACKRRIIQLENQLSNNQDDQLQAENEMLRNIRDEQKKRLDEVDSDLGKAKTELHRLRVGVTDKQILEKEKQVLEKQNRILSNHLDNLGKTVDDLTQSHQAEKPFPQMSWMDSASRNDWIKDRQATELNLLPEKDVPDLKLFAIELQHRIAQVEDKTPLYFRLEDIQLLIAGLAMSQLHIFQGISGTGKTSLAKAFAKAVGGQCTDIAVQAGWRDRDDLLGHYNAFEKRFYERDCLQGLYRAGTEFYRDRCNIILLDEMNLSRPEQYFAEFLSALEKNDPRERLISLSERPLPNAPAHLVEGRKIRIRENVWFVGTANHDETTNEFADKTYDRAHVMTLPPRHETSFDAEEKTRVSYSFKSLMERFDAAIKQNEDEVRDLLDDLTTGPLTRILQEDFDLGWGNRFETQALRFIPVFMAAGGHKEDALDHLLASRVFRRGKVTGRYDVDIDKLKKIEKVVTEIWEKWSSESRRSLELLIRDRNRKERNL